MCVVNFARFVDEKFWNDYRNSSKNKINFFIDFIHFCIDFGCTTYNDNGLIYADVSMLGVDTPLMSISTHLSKFLPDNTFNMTPNCLSRNDAGLWTNEIRVYSLAKTGISYKTLYEHIIKSLSSYYNLSAEHKAFLYSEYSRVYQKN